MKIVNILCLLSLSICSLNDLQHSTCDLTLCDPIGGYCVNYDCMCNKCYISLNLPNDHRKCNYAQSSSIKAGIIEFIFPIGFGHLYLGNIGNAVIKMILCLILVCGVYAGIAYYLINIRRSDEFFNTNHNLN